MLDSKSIQSEKGLRDLIARNLKKEIHPGTKPSIDFIKKILDEVYEEGLAYDVTDLRPRILAFANNSTNRPLECLKIVQQMKFKSDDEMPAPVIEPEDDRIVFFDVEVYPNLFVVCWKYEGKDTSVVRMINPTAIEVEGLFNLKLVGFNNRRYDNHILYARYLGYDNEALYNLSQKIINPADKSQRSLFGEAYSLSYADIFDFSSKKQGLKKFQIELDLPHQEMDHPWDQPVPEEKWDKVVEYCANDVTTTEQVFYAREQDFVARKILADISGLTVNDTTQKHTAKIIFGDDRAPQREFVYTDLSEEFPGYIYEAGKSTYKGEDPSEGGYVYAEPGMYDDVAVLDIASMHPTSIIELNLFGPYTKNFEDLVEARLAIKRGEIAKAKRMLGGRLAPYLTETNDLDALSYALKIVINIVYGLTSAKFDNPFRDVRNKDNIVAKRGALFMIDLKEFVEGEGFTVAHIKTDSIKIPNATQKIIDKVHEFGQKYGYTFEHEKTYDKFCLVNDAVYIARAGDEWDAVGAQFQHPAVFKTLFTFEDMSFQDLTETKSVSKGAIYIDFDHDRAAPLADGMHFIGRTGSFVPVNTGGGKLYRVYEDKSYALAGTKDYQWMESDMAQQMLEEKKDPKFDVDLNYYTHLVKEAMSSIQKFGSYISLVLSGRDNIVIPRHVFDLAGEGEMAQQQKSKEEGN
jgi:sulfur transfer complex TusBCD TusB component (DsrH family)